MGSFGLVFLACRASVHRELRHVVISGLQCIYGCINLTGRSLVQSQEQRRTTPRSSSVVRITGVAFGWIGATTAFGDVVKKTVDKMRLAGQPSPLGDFSRHLFSPHDNYRRGSPCFGSKLNPMPVTR